MKFYRAAAMMWVNLPSDFSDPLEIEYDGQSFTFDRIEPYVRKDGAESWVARWHSVCQQCGRDYTASSPLRVRSPVRKCQACRDANRKARRDYDRDDE